MALPQQPQQLQQLLVAAGRQATGTARHVAAAVSVAGTPAAAAPAAAAAPSASVPQSVTAALHVTGAVRSTTGLLANVSPVAGRQTSPRMVAGQVAAVAIMAATGPALMTTTAGAGVVLVIPRRGTMPRCQLHPRDTNPTTTGGELVHMIVRALQPCLLVVFAWCVF